MPFVNFFVGQPGYQLNDNFTTDRAAGAVNGTASEPGPGGNRVVVDTTGKLSIGSGSLQISSVVATQDPKITWNAVTRTPGRMAVIKWVQPNGRFEISFIDGSNVRTELLRTDAANQFVAFFGQGFALTPGNTYRGILILKAAGSFLFLNQGSCWQFAGYGSNLTDNTATLYPSFSNNTSGAWAYSVDFIRIPTILWLPTPLASDGFGGVWPTTDGLGHAEGVAGGIGSGGSGLTWQTGAGATWGLSGGKGVNTPTQGTECVDDPTLSTAGNWTAGAGWVVTTGAAATLASSTLVDTAGTAGVANSWYRVAATFTDTLGTVQFGTGGVYGPLVSSGSPVAHTIRATGTDTPTVNGSGFTGTVTAFSVKPLTLSSLFASLTLSSANVRCGVDVWRTAGLQAGLVLNLDSATTPTNFLICYLDGAGNCKVDECVAGTYANKLSAAVTYVAGARLVVVKESATTIRVFYNNSVASVLTTVTSNNNVLHGIFSTGNPGENSLDNFTCYAFGSSGEYNFLDQFIQ